MGWGRDRDQVRDDPELKPGPVRDGPGAVRTGRRGPGPGLRNASSARRGPPLLAPCEPSATESACARFLRAHLAQCEPR